jgi:hypothetical protein
MIIRTVFTFLLSLFFPFTSYGQSVKNQNMAFFDLSMMFFEDQTDPTFGIRYLDPKKLDFSIESLKYVDEYLEAIRKDKEVEKGWNKVVLRAGAYVGEVIRRNDKKTQWEWVDLDTAKSLDPKSFGSMPKVIGSVAMLYNDKSGFVFPLAKIEMYLNNGSEDSVYFFAQVILAK